MNRPAARRAVVPEFRQALMALVRHPYMGQIAASATMTDVRRLLLPTTRYFVHYRVFEADRTIEILALWHARRGTGPSL
jgi:plasmid stabilization system protein ParE